MIYCRHMNRTLSNGVRLAQQQRGVVLVITLILIVILSLLGTLAIRNATQSERSVNGIRSTEMAREAAETALRFCEQLAIFDADRPASDLYTQYGTNGYRAKIISAPKVSSEQDTAASWRTLANWKGDNAIEVPAQYYKLYSGGSVATDARQLKTAPRCIIQKLETPSTPRLEGYLITARGFANNATFDTTNGKTKDGAEAWLQSVLTRGS